MAYRPTPYSIALATLISLHCEEPSPLYSATSSSTEAIESNLDVAKVDTFLQELFLNNDESSNTRVLHLHATPVYKLVDRFSKCGVSYSSIVNYKDWLQTASQTIDSLTDLMATLKHSISDGSVDSSSSNGIFIRGVCLGFDELSFESTIQLWKDFSKETKFEQLFEKEAYLSQQKWTLSSEQLENNVRMICEQFSKSTGTDSLEVLRQIQPLIDHNPEMPSFHFLQFLICIESGERVGALDALHKYVDYVLIRSDSQLVSGNPEENTSLRRNEEILQFAAILKTLLHMNFGDDETAMAATEEAVRVAQQSQDPECVAFALGWLSLNAKDPRTSSQLMQQCIQRATESNLRSLVAGANLTSAARPDLLLSQSSPSIAVGATIQAQSEWVPWSDATSSDITSSADVDSCRWDRPTSIAHFTSEDRVLTTLGQQRLVGAGIWDRFGYSSQSSLYSLLALHDSAVHLSRDEINVAIQNIARRSLSGSCFAYSIPLTKNAYDTGTQDCKENNQQDVDAECIYGSSILQIMRFRELYGLQHDNFDMEIGLFLHEWAIRRGDLRQASALCCAMESQLHPRLKHNLDVSLDLYIQKSLLRTRQGQFDEAKSILNEQLEFVHSSKAGCKSFLLARILIQLTLTNLESYNQTEFASTIEPLMKCINLALENRLDGLHAVAQSLLAKFYMKSGDYRRSAALIRAVLPSLLQLAHVWFQAEAYLTLGKCILAKGKRLNNESGKFVKQIENCMKNALPVLKKSEQLFRKCQDYIRLREVYYLLARVNNEITCNAKDRDQASIRFAQISNLLEGEQSDGNGSLIAKMKNPPELRLLARRSLPVPPM